MDYFFNLRMKEIVQYCTTADEEAGTIIYSKLYFARSINHKRSSYHQHIPQRGDIVEAPMTNIESNVVLEHSTCGTGSKSFMVILSIGGITDQDPFVWVIMFAYIKSNLYLVPKRTTANFL